MCSEWMITKNNIGDRSMYAVYRLRNTMQTDHSGNREFASGYMEDRQEAVVIAEKLNAVVTKTGEV